MRRLGHATRAADIARQRTGGFDAVEQRIGGREKRHRGPAQRGGEVRGPGVDTDDEQRPRKQRGELRQRAPGWDDDTRQARGQPLAARLFGAITPGQHDDEAGVNEVLESRPPVSLRPEFFLLARAVKTHDVGRIGHGVGGGRGEIEPRRALRLVAQHVARQTPAAKNQMLARFDTVPVAIEQRRHRLVCAGVIRPVHRPLRKPGDQRALDLLLQVDDRIVAFVHEFVPERLHLAPGGARQQPIPPAPQGDGDDTAHAMIQAHQRRERLFGNPVDA